MEHKELTERIIGAAYKVHKTLGHGFLEKVYRNSLVLELRKNGLEAQVEVPIEVRYEGVVVGEYFADIIVNNTVILELKAVEALTTAHEVQLVNYLTATGKDIGLLINFGKSVAVKRKYRLYRQDLQDLQD